MYMNFEKISNHCAAFLHKFFNFHYNFACVREQNGVQVQGKIDGKLVRFVKRDEEFQDSSLEYLRSQIEHEIGELLPTEFKFGMKGIPVSGKQEMAYAVRDVAEGPSVPSTEADGVNSNPNNFKSVARFKYPGTLI